MTKTTDSVRHRDQLEAVLADTGTCILGCLDARGQPYLIPLLYDYADGGIYLVALKQTNWSEHLQRDGRVALYITRGTLRILIQGHAQHVAEPLYMRRLLNRHLPMSSEPVDTGNREHQSEQRTTPNSLTAYPEQRKVDSEFNISTWFFVRIINLLHA